MTELVLRFVRELGAVFLDASPYILLGFSVAAVIQVLLPVGTVQRLFGQGRVRSIFVASLLGIPLPLCSCSVLPTALALRKRGAGRGATVSFLVSTPETGIDSITLTYGLMDPLMAIYRPFAALVTALTAGFATEWIGGPDKGTGSGARESAAETADPSAVESRREPAADPASGHEPGPDTGQDHAHDRLAIEERQAAVDAGRSVPERLRAGFRSAFVELFDETSHWMLAGLVISAMIAVALPAEVVTQYLSSGVVPLVLMLVIGIPLYICASASTPIAAALVLKGLSPGAALVFLLAGPATNVGSLAILSRFLGRRVMVIYLASIAVLSLLLGAILDGIYRVANIDPGAVVGQARMLPAWVSWPSAAVFAGLLLLSFRRARPPGEFLSVARGLQKLVGIRITARLLTRLAILVLVVWIVSLCVVVVPPGHQALITTFGAPAGGPYPEGLHFKWPPPIGAAEVISADGVRRIEIGFRTATPAGGTDAPRAQDLRTLEEESLFLTGDENLISLRCTVQFRLIDSARYAWGFGNPVDVIRLESISAMLDVLAAYPIDAVYTDDRREVELLVLDEIRERAIDLDLGVEVLGFQIRDVHAPPEVHAAFRDVASAQEDKQTAINVALRYRDETVNLARGEAARQVEVAKSEVTADVLRAEGASRSLYDRSNAYREHAVGTFTRLYLETVEEVLARGRKIIRPGWSGSGGIDLWISTGEGLPLPVADVLRGGDVRRAQEAGD